MVEGARPCAVRFRMQRSGAIVHLFKENKNMKKIVKTPKKFEKVVEVVTEEVTEVLEGEGGPVTLLGKEVYVCCSSYAYTGTLSGVNDKFIEVSDPAIVYETGPWTSKDWKDVQKLPTKSMIIFQSQIEVLFEVSR